MKKDCRKYLEWKKKNPDNKAKVAQKCNEVISEDESDLHVSLSAHRLLLIGHLLTWAFAHRQLLIDDLITDKRPSCLKLMFVSDAKLNKLMFCL